MFTDTQVLSQLAMVLPPSDRRIVVSRLCRIPALWKELRHEAFLKRAMEFAGSNTARWLPGTLGLLLATEPALLDLALTDGGITAAAVSATARAKVEAGLKAAASDTEYPLDQAALAAIGILLQPEALASVHWENGAAPMLAACAYSLVRDRSGYLKRLAAELPRSATAFVLAVTANEEIEGVAPVCSEAAGALDAAAVSALADTAARLGEAGLSKALAQQLLQREPDSSPQSELLRARLYRRIDEPASSVISAEKARQAAKDLLTDSFCELACASEIKKDYSGALTYWQEAAILIPESARVRTGLAHSLAGLGRMDESIRALPGATEDADDLAGAAEVYLLAGQADRAREIARNAFMRLNPSEKPQTAKRIAELLEKADDSRGSAQALQSLGNLWPAQAEIQTRLAASLGRTGEWALCAQAAARAAALDPDDLAALRWQGMAAEKTGSPAEAAAHFKTVLDRQPGDAEAALALARNAQNAGDRITARKAADTALSINPEAGEALAILGRLALEDGDETLAFETLQKATRLAPASVYPWLALSGMHYSKGNLEAAMTTLRAGAELAEDKQDILLALGRILGDNGKYREATAVLERAERLKPGNPEASYLLAKAYLPLGGGAEAEAALQRALEANPAHVHAAKLMADTMRKSGRWADARKTLERAVSAAPESVDLLSSLGGLLIDQYRSDGEKDHPIISFALSLLTRAVSLAGNAPTIQQRLSLGWAQLLSGNLTDAVSTFSALVGSLGALSTNEKAEALRGMAEALLRLGDTPSAISSLQNAVTLLPEDSGLRAALGAAFQAAGLFEDAMNCFRQIAAEHPTDLTAVDGLAAAFASLGRQEESNAALLQAAEMDPMNPNRWLRLAGAYLTGGQTEKARGALAHSLEHGGSEDPRICLNAARLLAGMKEFAQSSELLDGAIAKNPDDIELVAEAGKVARATGNFARAHDAFRRAGEMDPSNAMFPRLAAETLWEDGRKSAAIAFWKKAAQADPADASLPQMLAARLSDLGLHNEALPFYEKSLALQPSDAALALEAGQIAYLAGDMDRASEWKDMGLRLCPDSADGLALKARLAMKNHQSEEMLGACNDLVTKHAQDARSWALLAMALAGTDARGSENDAVADPAMEALQKAIDLSETSAEGSLQTAEAAMALEEYGAAIQCLRRLAAEKPEDADAHLLLAKAVICRAEAGYRNSLVARDAVFSEGDTESGVALTALMRASGLGAAEDRVKTLTARAELAFHPVGPDSLAQMDSINEAQPDPEGYLAAAQGWLKAGDRARAMQSAESAVRLDSGSTAARFLYAVAKFQAGEMEAAKSALQETITRTPHWAPAYALKSVLLAEASRTRDAITEMRKAVRRNPNVAEWQHLLGGWLAAAGNIPAALPCLQKAVELKPEKSEFRIQLARTLARDGDPAAALEQYRRGAALLPAVSGALSAEIAKTAMESGNAGEAYAAYATAIDQNTASAPYPWLLGKARAALGMGKGEEARQLAQKVLESPEKPAEAHLVLAEAAEHAGDNAKAIEHLNLAAAGMSDPMLPGLRLAKLWTATGSANRSIQTLKALLDVEPENDEARHLLAEANLEAGKLDDGLREAQRACDLAPRVAAHWELRGRIARRMGQLDQALSSLDKARSLSPHSWRTELETGLVYEAQKRWDLAIDAYRKGLQRAPQNADLHFRMGVVHKNLRAYAESAVALRKAVQIEPKNLAAHRLLSGVLALSLVYGSPATPAKEAR